MSPLSANFPELYRRHLHRHSELGVNLNHVVSVLGVYLCLFGLLDAGLELAGVPDGRRWALLLPLVPYFAVMAKTLPAKTLLALAVVLAALWALYAWGVAPLVPLAWSWIYLPLLPLFHQLQQVGHRFYKREYDMAEFAAKYPKGGPLFRLLALYELPILVHYFLVGTAPLGDKRPVVT